VQLTLAGQENIALIEDNGEGYFLGAKRYVLKTPQARVRSWKLSDIFAQEECTVTEEALEELEWECDHVVVNPQEAGYTPAELLEEILGEATDEHWGGYEVEYCDLEKARDAIYGRSITAEITRLIESDHT